jgi:acyl-CoA hydrolase
MLCFSFIQMVFFEGETPVFKSVDDIQFVLPVSVDSVMEFTSTVVYSQDLHIVVQVRIFLFNHLILCTPYQAIY